MSDFVPDCFQYRILMAMLKGSLSRLLRCTVLLESFIVTRGTPICSAQQLGMHIIEQSGKSLGHLIVRGEINVHDHL